MPIDLVRLGGMALPGPLGGYHHRTMHVISEDIESTFEDLDRAECLQLLSWESLGRLATGVALHPPEIVPVNFVLDDDSVVFRSSPERAAKLAGRHASFEIDRFDQFQCRGWSVVVSGILDRVPEDSYPDALLKAWAPGRRHSLLRLHAAKITGRRITRHPWTAADLGYL